ncbi:hypothetical protein HUG10_19550 (plasmid) [Halorarum halophilum]|uniref:DUF2975 domain-containing protein n=1 Tax=Halorarum halophilum TaxID=2743090 RepID=A0A7D5GIA6_9EURY|nr:hypothetical protein [Halobaculum halophilum]QLG29810.1 hypothetical protein HUG10_19550 [Halobaculum halophilum]
MSRQFIRAKPLQACKLIGIVATFVFSAGVFSELISDPDVITLLLIPILALGLAIAIAAETLIVGYRSLRSGGLQKDLLANRPVYSIVRAVEVFLVILSVGIFIFIITTLPDGPMAGPGAIGLWFIMVGLGLLILGGSLVRTLTEYYYHRQSTIA